MIYSFILLFLQCESIPFHKYLDIYHLGIIFYTAKGLDRNSNTTVEHQTICYFYHKFDIYHISIHIHIIFEKVIKQVKSKSLRTDDDRVYMYEYAPRIIMESTTKHQHVVCGA